jgi:UDP-N-acetylglucosamine transferase subunit ALG13
MIFVTVGTNEAKFDRLLDWVARAGIEEELLIQHGHSSPIGSPHARLVDFFSYEQMVENMDAARVVITHAGVGSVLVALANGKRPVVVPRLKALAEAVDDHQLQLGHRFGESGLVTLVQAPEDLKAALEHVTERAAVRPSSSSLAADLRDFLQETIGATRTVRA